MFLFFKTEWQCGLSLPKPCSLPPAAAAVDVVVDVVAAVDGVVAAAAAAVDVVVDIDGVVDGVVAAAVDGVVAAAAAAADVHAVVNSPAEPQLIYSSMCILPARNSVATIINIP